MDNLEFQLYDFCQSHEMDDDCSDDEGDNGVGKYIVHYFARTLNDKSVYCKVTGYTPYFYVGYKDNLKRKQADKIVEYLKASVYPAKFRECLIKHEIVNRKVAKGFNGEKDFRVLRLIFDNFDAMKKFGWALSDKVFIPELSDRKVKLDLFESNLLPMFRMNHINKISGCGWVSVLKSNCEFIENEDEKDSYCDIEIRVNWKNLQAIEKTDVAPFHIASFDIETFSCDGQFPQAHRKDDKIIQIGTTYSKYGNSECYRKHIVTLNGCSPIKGVVVESYSTEKKLLKGWKKEIIRSDCDIMTGYNIFFFDEPYIRDRTKILYIDDEFCYFSKLKKWECKFKEITLSSSALGDNSLKWYDTPGRVHVDLMKYIQKEFKLDSYKLDNVLSEYISGCIKKVKQIDKNHWKLYCKSINDLHDDDFIHIETKESFISDRVGTKFQVYKLKHVDKDDCKGIIYINCKLDLDNEIDFLKQTVFWSQGKDDVGPKDIFRLQEGNDDDRAIVGKYCVKDCSGCNVLFNKLSVGSNNIQMANVCHVPMQFLFVRGQGIKIFSLVSKKYRDSGYIFPVITKPKNVPEEEDGYEGAIVFEPVPGIYYAPLTTLDYASLYPKSMIHKNISHETIVEDPSYFGLDDYVYFDAKFVNNNDGSMTKCKFAKRKDGKLGIIPQILDDLLGERSAVKKLMGAEQDPFKKAILDGLQLALKITANSLYGQLGAKTSPIFCKKLAACTTSTGREMLLYAKKYGEEIYPSILNGLLYSREDKDQFNKIISEELRESIIKDEKKYKKFSDTLNNILDHIEREDLTVRPIVRYGDSVVENTPIIVKNNNNVQIVKICDLGSTWIKYGDKEACDVNNIFVWTDIGWTKINKVIKHKTNKKIYRVLTHTGCVDVTEDHSLIDKDKNKIKPTECKVGTQLLQSYPEIEKLNNQFSENDAHNIGKRYRLLCKDVPNSILTSNVCVQRAFWNGYSDNNKFIKCSNMTTVQTIYMLMSNIGYNVLINIDNDNYILTGTYDQDIEFNVVQKIVDMSDYYYKDVKEIVVYDLETENHHFQAGVGNIIVHNTDSIFIDWQYFKNSEEVDHDTQVEVWENVVSFGRKMFGFFVSNEEKTKWKTVFNALYDKIPELRLCYIDEENDKMFSIIKEFMEERYLPWLWSLQEAYMENRSNFDKLICDWSEYIISEFGFVYCQRDPKYCEYGIKYFLKNFLKDYILQPYVYYLENDKRVIKIKIFKKGNRYLGEDCLDLSIKTGILSGDLIKSRLPFPHDLEYEKTFDPFLILKKKKYVGHKYEFNSKKFSLNVMGIVLKRRDNAPIVKEICGGIVNRLLIDKDPEKAVKFCEESLDKMVKNKYNIKYFLTSKSLKAYDNYKDYTKIGHAVLSKRIGKRDPGNEPQSGDRVTFGYVKVSNWKKGMLQGDKIETPEFIKQNNLELDYNHYITNQIQKPATQFLELAIPNVDELFNQFKT
jgi:DNA polymerase elongation subunit (family B)